MWPDEMRIKRGMHGRIYRMVIYTLDDQEKIESTDEFLHPLTRTGAIRQPYRNKFINAILAGKRIELYEAKK